MLDMAIIRNNITLRIRDKDLYRVLVCVQQARRDWATGKYDEFQNETNLITYTLDNADVKYEIREEN